MGSFKERQLNLMIESIILYQNKDIQFGVLVNKLSALAEVVRDNLPDHFIDSFHKYWDFLEEILAVEGELEYYNKIREEIIPGLLKVIRSYL